MPDIVKVEPSVFEVGITLRTDAEREQRKRNNWQKKQFADLMLELRKIVDAEIATEQQPVFVPIRRIKGCLEMVTQVSQATGLSPIKVLENALWAMNMLSNNDRRKRPTHTHADLAPHPCMCCGNEHAHCCEDGEFCLPPVLDA